ncbi:MAG: IS607 family transposase [Erysipelotrichaceae bacterium]
MKIYKTGEFAELIGVTITTIQRWDRSGKLKAYRTPTNKRYYTHEQLQSYLGQSPAKTDSRSSIIYARVSSRGQQDDLKNQVAFLKTFANARGVIIDEVIEDLGSGLNYNRKEWNKLLDRVLNKEISVIYITHKDRFIRFGYEWFERLCKKYNTEIVIVNNEELSPQEEMVQDIISILHVFSCRIYGLRKYKKKIREDEEIC